MKVLIFGATGMLGHKLMLHLSHTFDTYGTTRHNKADFPDHIYENKSNLIGNVSAEDKRSVIRAIQTIRPEIVINCVGIIKQLPESKDPVKSITINSLFPHILANYCNNEKIRVIHISTDCVFSGNKGNYSEDDTPDAIDLYGRSKLLGELIEPNCLTLRTSLIGRELNSTNGLLEWFLTKRGEIVKGYKNAIFSGFTTNALSDIIKEIITKYPNLEGVNHVSSTPISKFDLLLLVKEKFNLDVQIEADETVVMDRSLDSSKFRHETRIRIPSWTEMIEQLLKDPFPYTRYE